MYNYLQKLFEDISKEYIKECFKISILPALISIGGGMITQSIIGWILVFLGFSIGIYQIKQEWNKYTSIKDKIIFLDNNSLPRIFINDNKLNISIIADIHNCSLQTVFCSIDTKRTQIIINGHTKAKDEYVYTTINWLSPPYSPSWAATDFIAISLDKLDIGYTIKITAEIYVYYYRPENEEKKYEIYKKIETSYSVTQFDKDKKLIEIVPINFLQNRLLHQ